MDVTGYSLRIPTSWAELDVRPASRDARIRGVIADRVAAAPQLRPMRAEMTRFVRDLARRSWEAGVRYCAVFVEPAGKSMIPGALTIASLPAAPGGNTADSIVDELQLVEPSPVEGTWRSLSVVDLPDAGRAVRTWGIQDVVIDERGTVVRSVLMQTYIPLPDRVLLVSCTSPALDLADPLFELFATVTDTIELVEEDA